LTVFPVMFFSGNFSSSWNRFGSIVMVYLQTYKLCILTLLCRSTVLWLSPFGNFGYILFIFLTYYLGLQTFGL
jgi:hypothetical protein